MDVKHEEQAVAQEKDFDIDCLFDDRSEEDMDVVGQEIELDTDCLLSISNQDKVPVWSCQTSPPSVQCSHKQNLLSGHDDAHKECSVTVRNDGEDLAKDDKQSAAISEKSKVKNEAKHKTYETSILEDVVRKQPVWLPPVGSFNTSLPSLKFTGEVNLVSGHDLGQKECSMTVRNDEDLVKDDEQSVAISKKSKAKHKNKTKWKTYNKPMILKDVAESKAKDRALPTVECTGKLPMLPGHDSRQKKEYKAEIKNEDGRHTLECEQNTVVSEKTDIQGESKAEYVNSETRIFEDVTEIKAPIMTNNKVEKLTKTEVKRLPIDDHKERILDCINKNRVTCIQGETGSGKSTRVPQYIVEQYKKKIDLGESTSAANIIITQPRRIAAKSLADRVAQELGEKATGGIVGYKMGREQKVSESTQVCYVTTGFMIEMLIHNPAGFNDYSHVIMDEIHERELDADLLSLMIRILMTDHPNPKLIIMSATLDAKLFLDYFGDLCQMTDPADRLLFVGVKSPYTVQTHYLENVEVLFKTSRSHVPKGAYKLLQDTRGKFYETAHRGDVWPLNKYLMLGLYLVQARANPGSSILIFLPGVREIDEMYELLLPYENMKPRDWSCHIIVFPLHSKIPFEDQQECFRKPDANKCNVILATNIAESSITLPDISVIIDFGQRRHVTYDTKKRMSVVKLDWCSQASMNQRKGRTGRVCDGVCIRVMTEAFFKQVREFDEAQMKKAPLDKLFLNVKHVVSGCIGNLLGAHLCCKSVGLLKASGLQYAKSIAPQSAPSAVLKLAVEPPDPERVTSAIKNLADIGALSSEDELSDVTMLGRLCLALPVDLYLCRMVMFGILLNKPCDAIVMAAALQSQDPFSLPSYKILKNQEKFIKSQKRSYDFRCHYDQGTYSQPIMLRNMLIDWFSTVDDENKKRKRENKGLKHGKNLKDFRREFTSNHSLDPKRLSLLEGVVVELAEKTLRWIPKGNPIRNDVGTLIEKVPRRMKNFADEGPGGNTWISQTEEYETVGDLFRCDLLLLHMILAASLVPKFVFGEVRDFIPVSPNYKGNRIPKSEEHDMIALDMDPMNTVSISIAKWPDIEEDDIDDLIQCISLVKYSESDDDFLLMKTYQRYRFTNKKLFIEFSPEFFAMDTGCGLEFSPEFFQVDTENGFEVTHDVNPGIYYVFQFAKEGMYKVSEYKEGAEKRAQMGEEINFKVQAQHPYRIQWELMCSDGSPLKEGSSFCMAYPEWRNPAGFMFDANKDIHLGLAAGITASYQGANQANSRCWMETFCALPICRQNLYALLLMLAYLPHKHDVLFHIDRENMVIRQVTIFRYDIPVGVNFPLTKRLMKIINKIREITSKAFCGVDSSHFRREIHMTDLPEMYELLIKEMERSEAQIESLDEYQGYSHLVKVSGFHEDPNREPVNDVYLKPYNIELLFTKHVLKRYLRT